MGLHLLKTAVGVPTIATLAERQARFTHSHPDHGVYVSHSTRNRPKRADALLGGSIYWIVKGEIAARNAILDIETADDERGRARCQFLLSPELVPTVKVRKRAIQGWRYLEAPPADLPRSTDGQALPEDLAKDLRRLGLL